MPAFCNGDNVFPDKINTPPINGAKVAAKPLKDCEKLILLVAVAGSPKTVIYGLAAVSRKAAPENKTNNAARKNAKFLTAAAGKNKNAPHAKSMSPKSIPPL